MEDDFFQLIMQGENDFWTSIEVLNWTIKAGIMEKNRNRATPKHLQMEIMGQF